MMMHLNEMSCVRSLKSLSVVDAPTLCSFDEDCWRFDYYFSPRHSNVLLVFFPAALTPDKRYVPAFHRWSWAFQLPEYDILALSDPTLYLDEHILGGWLQGTSADWILTRILAHLRTFQELRNYQQIVFCGFSSGGFAALQAATLITNSFLGARVMAYTENPQISLIKYSIRRHMNLLASVCYGVSSLDKVDSQFHLRLDIVSLIASQNHVPPGLVVIKESDIHHHGVQLEYLRSGLQCFGSNSLDLEVIPVSIDSSGHTPLTLQQMRSRIDAILRK
mgnify:CR=1 FL=1